MSSPDPPPAQTPPTRGRAARLVRSTFAVTLAGSLLLWLAQPGTPGQLAMWLGLPSTGLSLGVLGWIAPAPWLWLIARPESFGRGRYAQVWLGGVVYWLLTLHWITLPHPLTPLGWPLLAGYMALYLLAFVWLTRRAISRAAAPLWLAAPVVWVAMEFLQAHLFTGFLMGALSHTQTPFPLVIQISNLVGAYGVSFVMIFGAAAIVSQYECVRCRGPRSYGVAWFALLLAACALYGGWSLRGDPRQPGPTVALVQGAEPAVWETSEEYVERQQRIINDHIEITRRAMALADERHQRVDLVVWPESMFRATLVTFGGRLAPPDELPANYRAAGGAARSWFDAITQQSGAAMMVGADRVDLNDAADGESPPDQTVYNAVVLADAEGAIRAFYDKTHRVPFGEYIPLAKDVPALYYLTPMSGGLGEGEGPVAMEVATQNGPVRFAPNVCYETVIPHVIRRHVAELTRRGQKPDVLVNVTNDAWFWGASELDLHLACGVLRAVENRTPLVIAANTGLSAVVDSTGHVLEKSHRMQEDVIVSPVPLDDRGSFYSAYGDWFAMACLLATVVLALVPRRTHRK